MLFIGGFLFFMAFTTATQHHQNTILLRSPMLVGFFQAGLVIHGGFQAWWIAPVITSLNDQMLMLGATILTAFNDNAAITYLAAQLQDIAFSAKHAVVAGGGLTVIANAPAFARDQFGRNPMARLAAHAAFRHHEPMDPGSQGMMVLLTAITAAAMPAGGWLAMIGSLHPGWLDQEHRHTILAFGAGVLLAAVALVLVPEGAATLAWWPITLWFVSGGLAFMGLDILLEKRKTPGAQMAAMLADFLPESIAMGAAFAKGNAAGFSLALLIALQNIPEGFNAFREMAGRSRVKGRRVLIVMACMVPLGPLAGWLGMEFLAPHAALIGGIMVFAAGGILYAIFQDIAPQVRLARHWAPPMGAVAGFLVGWLGNLWIAG